MYLSDLGVAIRLERVSNVLHHLDVCTVVEGTSLRTQISRKGSVMKLKVKENFTTRRKSKIRKRC